MLWLPNSVRMRNYINGEYIEGAGLGGVAAPSTAFVTKAPFITYLTNELTYQQ